MINVIGLGYIGLPTALMFAKNNVSVIGTDYNPSLVRKLNKGQITFDEKGLDELFHEALENKISFSTEYQKADIYIVAVPTPYEKENKRINASYVINATKQILEVCDKGAIIVIESTISPGTIDKYIKPLFINTKFKLGEDIHIAHAPERIIPGNMIFELTNNSRTIGADDSVIGERVKKAYGSFCKGEIIVTDIRTAEMSKVVENTYRDINIAFANELAKICHSDNLDVHEIIKIANMHPRVNILQPGPGVGGHCISVDPWFLVGDYPMLANLILQARKVNDSMPEFILDRIHQIMKENNIVDLDKVGLYGLTYKENVDDVRESPTLQLLESMQIHLSKGLKVFDPCVKEQIVPMQYTDFNAFLSEVDLVVVMVPHQHIKDNISLLANKLVFDTKNALPLEKKVVL